MTGALGSRCGRAKSTFADVVGSRSWRRRTSSRSCTWPTSGPDRALVAWGGFWFHREDADARWDIVDDEQLGEVDPGRTESIGARSTPYGDAVVEVVDESGALVASARTDERNHVWVTGLQPDTGYRYRVLVDGEEWAAGERWDWGPVPTGAASTCGPGGRSYDLRSGRTRTRRCTRALDFVVLGDYGVGRGCRTRRAAAGSGAWPRCSTGWSTGTTSGW